MRDNDLPRATRTEDGRALVDGERDAFVQGMIRSFDVRMDDLAIVRGYSGAYDAVPSYGVRLSGVGYVERGDSLEVAGLRQDVPSNLSVSLRPVEADSKYVWRANIGFIANDWEIGGGDSFFIEGYVPPEAFTAAEAAFLSARTKSVHLTLSTSLWISELDWHTPQSDRVRWFLLPSFEERRSPLPMMESGDIQNFSWEEKPPNVVRPPPLPAPNAR